MDVEARLLHAVVGNRIKAQLKDAIPSTQQRFLPGRNGALNVIKLIVLAESNNRGILRRPGMVISQDQHKAYDVLSRDWVLHTLTAAGAPTEFINLVSSLWADSTIVFHVDEGECPPVLVGRGLPQGVISSVMLYLLAYQPFIDAWENTRGGISVQVGDESYRLSSISYADNSDFFLGSKKDLTAFKKLRTHFDRVSDSSINPSESFATILRNQSSPPLPDWFKEALDLYPERKADSAFKYLGRTLRMDGLPCAGLPNRVSKALHSAAHHIRRHFSLFSAARALHDFGFSKIALMFDGPYDYEETFKAIKLEARKYFYDGNGQSIRWDLLSLPRNLGGLGLLDPILANEISLVRQICSIFVGNDSDLKGLIVALMALEYNDICGCPLSSLLAAPVKAVSRIEIGHKSFSRRCLFALQLLGLNSSMPTDLASADPTAVVLLPFHSTYPFDLSDFTRADDWERCVDILRSLGISSFLDLLWEDQSLRVEDDGSQSKLTRLRLRPPRMDEVRAFHPKVEIFDARAQRYGFQPATAFNLLQQNWPKLLAAWPSTFVDLLARFFEARPNFAGIPLRGSSRARPHADRLKPNLPFDLLTISDLPLSKFTTKAGRSWYYGTKCAMPGNPNNDYQGLHAHNTFLLPGAGLGLDSSDSDDDFETVEETTPLASASEWRLEVHWKSVWPFLHELILPGVGRACWWLILHQRASVARTATYKVARCPGCCEVSSSSDHIYLECPHFRKVWLALAEVAVAVVGETFDLAMIRTATPGAIALGFPTIYSSLRPIGRIRFKVWVAICMSVMMSAVRGLPRGDAQSTPPSLDPLRLRTKCVKEMFGFTCLFHAGPSRLSSSQFESHWLANNRLILKSGSKLLLHNIGLIPVASPTHFSQDLIAYDGQAQPTASTSSGTTLVRLTAPAEQDWVKDPQRHRVCRCCHARSPVWERNTVFCAGCFVMRFPDTPLDTSAQRSYWTMKRTCKTCGGGEGSRSMTWNCAPTDYSCKCCGKKRQRMERKSQTCEGCFERNTGMPMPPGLGTADKRARPCANCPAAAPSSSQHHNAANPPSSSGFRSSKRPPPARDVGEALLLSQSSITTFIASSPSQSTPAPSSQQQDDVAPAAPHPASQSRSSKKARPSRDAGAMASLSQSSLTGFLDGSDS
ncbi:hypothetical protein [Sporisorium scitamineum]|nr:hypothetical protein [Sporisorium scitamineum]